MPFFFSDVPMASTEGVNGHRHEVIAPPPRSKRNAPTSAPMLQQQNKNTTRPRGDLGGRGTGSEGVKVLQKTPIKRPPSKPPKPPNIVTTSRVASDFQNGQKYYAKKPPKPPLPTLTSNGNGEHIYESIDARPPRLALPGGQNYGAVNNLKLSAEAQAWPWAKQVSPPQSQQGVGLHPSRMPYNVASRQASLPPQRDLAVGRTNANKTSNFLTNLRSVSLGRGQEAVGGVSKPTLFQRFNSLRRSFNSRERLRQATSVKTQTALTSPSKTAAADKSLPRRPDDPDWVFFRGFGGKRREDMEPYSVYHGPLLAVQTADEALRPQAPPRRKRPQRLVSEDGEAKPPLPLRRSLSFTHAHFIAQAVYEGDTKLIEELYPDFPRSEPIYAVVNKSAKNRNNTITTNKTTEPCITQNQIAASMSTTTAGLSALPVHQEASDEDSKASARSSSIGSCNAGVAQRLPAQQPLGSAAVLLEQLSNSNAHAQKSVQENNIHNGRGRDTAITDFKHKEDDANNQRDKEATKICANNQEASEIHVTDSSRIYPMTSDQDRVTFNSSVMFVRQADSKRPTTGK